jgi:hypothetical protein
MKKSGLSLILLSLVLVSSLMFVSAQDSVFDKSPTSAFMQWITDFLGLGGTFKEIIIGIIVFAILFAGIYNILELTSLFDIKWVKILISAGLGVIAALTGLINRFSIFMLSFAAGLGTLGVVLEIIIAIVIFIGLSFGSNKIAKWAAKRKGQKEEIAAITSADEAAAAMVGLRRFQKRSTKKKT